jgi:ketosteroid isomerase-like protein
MADTKSTIHDLETRRFKAMCDADAAALGELLAEGLVYTHSNAATDGKASYIAGVTSGKWKYRKIERPVEDIQVHGDSAIVTGQVRIEAVIEGQARTLNSRYIDVWTKGAKGWQMSAWQSTPIPA